MRLPFPARLVAALAVVAALVVGTWPPWPTAAQVARIGPYAQTFTSAASPPIKACGLSGQNAATFQSTGAGPIDASISNDGYSWTPAQITTTAGAVQAQPFTPTSGTTYQVTPLTGDCVEIAPDSTWSTQTATITFKASGAIATVPTPGGGGGSSSPVQPSPLYTTPVSCVTPSCNMTAYQGTSPWVVSTPTAGPAPTASAGAAFPAAAPYNFSYVFCENGSPSNISANNAIPLQCNSSGFLNVNCNFGCPTPGPTASPGGYIVRQLAKVGSGTNTYLDTYPDTLAVTGAISTATTTLLKAGVANQNMYVWYAAFQTSGTNTSNTVNLEYGQTTTTPCDTSPVLLLPSGVAPGATSGLVTALYGAANQSGNASGIVPAVVPWIVPASATPNNLCIVTTGTTTSGKGFAYVAIHAN
jgi:hypothetical protein